MGSSSLSVNGQGAATYAIPIAVAPGRAGLKPALQLKYSSTLGNGLYGQGWQLDVGRIERSLKNGAPGYNDSDVFVLTLGGAQHELVHIGNGEYRLKDEGAFLQVIKNSDHWLVRDRNGVEYQFGQSVRNAEWPVGAAQPYRWNLDRVVDVSGNEMTFHYINDASGYRLNEINYPPFNKVQFTYDFSRTDVIRDSYRSGYLESVPVARLTRVTNKVGTQTAYDMGFEYNIIDGVSVLTKATSYAQASNTPTANRVMQFGYGTKENMPFPGGVPGIGYLDINGDGIMDQLDVTWSSTRWDEDGRFKVQIASSPGVYLASSPYYAYNMTYMGASSYKAWRGLIDMNGDGLTDYVTIADATPGDPSGALAIHFNNGAGWDAVPEVWNDYGADPNYLVTLKAGGDDMFYHAESFYDVNGDGLPDRIYRTSYNENQHYVAINNGHGFDAPYLSTLNLVSQEFAGILRGAKGHFVYYPMEYKKTTMMTSVTNPVNNMVQNINYGIESNIANAAGLKLWVVNSVSRSIPGFPTRSASYTYSGGLYDEDEKELRGYATVTVTNSQTGNINETGYLQDQLYKGRTSYTESRLSGGRVISRTDNTWTSRAYDAGTRNFVYSQSEVTSNYELDGSLITQTTTNSNTYDDCGNALSSTTSSNDGYSKTTNNEYTVCNLAGWQLGKLFRAKVTATSPTDTGRERVTEFQYDANGRLKKEIVEPDKPALTLNTEYGYDGFGNRETTTISGYGIPAPRTTTVAYDGNGYLPTSTTNALGHTETYTWDARFGEKTSLTGPNGLTTSWEYDGFGRNVLETRADGTSSTVTYHLDAAPFYVTTQSTGSPAQTVYYDALGRETRSQAVGFSGANIFRDVEYDSLGRLSRKSRPYSTGDTLRWATYVYDELDRKTSIAAPSGGTLTMAYNGLSTTATNFNQQVKTTRNNSRGQVVSSIDHYSKEMVYEYDGFGNLTKTTDAAQNSTTMTYDIRGRKEAMIDPDMGSWSYQYDALGNLTSQTIVHPSMAEDDELGRMTSRSEPEGASTWVYDTLWVGALSSQSGVSSSKSYSYDGFGRVITSTTSVNGQFHAVDTTYDTVGRVATITYPVGNTGTRLAVQRNYNAQGFMASVTNLSTGVVAWQADVVDAEGRTLQESFGNGLTTLRQYNNGTRFLESIVTGNQVGGTEVQNLSYGFDTVANLTSRSNHNTGVHESFAYDDLNRLRSVTGPASKTYSYYANGNIKNKSDVGVNNFTYDPNHPHAVATAGGNSYSYDANGNMLAGAGRTHSWTSFNKPLGIWTAGGYTGFTYDANHNRITKTTPNSMTVYIGKIFEQVTMGGVTKDVNHIYAGSKLVASVENITGVIIEKYMHGDHLGSINVITDSAGAVLERLSFDAFGKPRNVNGTDGTVTSVH
jgi:YD repeat-containing protein